ncbi:MAG: hypothetical protein PHD21_04335 [Flavobacteriales bacterium]|nr:hypothetical protein [Flavobacteriales bacterium]
MMLLFAFNVNAQDKKEKDKTFTYTETGPIYHKSCLRYINDNKRLFKCNNSLINRDLVNNIHFPKDINGNYVNSEYINGMVWVKIDIKKNGTCQSNVVRSPHASLTTVVL